MKNRTLFAYIWNMLLEFTSGTDLVLEISQAFRDIKLLEERKKVRFSIQCHKYGAVLFSAIKKFKFRFHQLSN